MSSTPAALRPASTVVLARPSSSGLEVFLVRRHDNVAFMGGAHVFPGGRVDDDDYLSDPERWCEGVGGAVARMSGRAEDQAIAFHVAAIRELFEEAGVLLARDAQGFVAGRARDGGRLDAWRRELLQHRVTMRELAEREQVRLALDALAVFGHWVTPDIETRRFDTYFFFAVAPDVQEAAHDEHETTQGTWIEPQDAIERCRRGEIALPPPTWTTLRALSQRADVDDAWAWASAHPVPRVEPRAVEPGDGTRIVALPGDPMCPPVPGFEVSEKRFLLEGGRWRPIDGPRG